MLPAVRTWGVGYGVFSLQMDFDSFGGSGGLVIRYGPEMTGFVCVCGVGSVYGLVKGESICLLIGQMCCLLHLYLQPWPSIRYELGI